MKRSRWARLFGLPAATALVLASCGGGNDSATGDAGGEPTGDGGRSSDGGTGLNDSSLPIGSDAMVAPPSDGAVGSCLGSTLLSELGKDHLLVGGSMQDATAAMAPFDARYIYISGGLFDGTAPCTSCTSNCTTGGTSCSGGACSWWGCWQDTSQAPGQYPGEFVSTCSHATPAQIPMITYYEILQGSGANEGAGEVTAANDATFMHRYFADWRFLLQKVGQSQALFHVEPDFWGYAMQVNPDPTAIPAAVASANSTDCAGMPNTIAGMGKCMIAMVRTYAPNAKVGLHASAWATNIDVTGNTSPSLDVAGEAMKLATFLLACGAGSADFDVVETSDRDAGYYASIGRDTAWDATNTTLPDFHQDFAWATALAEAVGKPNLWWQTPLGNALQNNTTDHWQDNRVQYFFGHMNEMAAAHGVGVVYGAGATGQTTPESDGGYFVSESKAYFMAGGQALCE
jgi:hypothetical protein